MRVFEAETLSGSVIEAVDGELDVLSSNDLEAHVLGEELADQAIHILIGAALPGRVRMGEEEVCPEARSDTLMLGEFPAVVGGQGMHAGSKRR